MLIEITTFTLAPDADRDALLAADQRLQHKLNTCPGILRRTTAEGDSGWVVIALWADAESADEAESRLAADETSALNRLFGDAETRRYRALEG